MTTIKLTNEYLIEAKGHAGSKEMCAAISTLLQVIVCWLMNYETEFEYQLSPGDAYIRFPPGGEKDTVFNLAVVGFSQLSATSAEQVKILYEN